MSSLSGAVETAPVSDLHALGSTDPADFPVPGGREEEWRFTPLRRLRGLHSDAALTSVSDPRSGVTVEVEAAPELLVEKIKNNRRCRTVPADSDWRVPADRPGQRPCVRRRHRGDGHHGPEGHGGVGRRPTSASPAPTRPSRPPGTWSSTCSRTGAPPSSSTSAARPPYADNVEIHVGDGGDLVVVALADWAGDTVQVAHHQVTLGRDAHLAHFAVTLGGSLVRLSPTVRYAGPGGDAELTGIAFADAGQHLEHRLFVDHDTPNCRSRVSYKGALRGEGAHTVWIGDVLIQPEATGTDTYEYNRNLILTDEARADSVPNLEILTGEIVGAGHASASGRLDDEHTFYLMSRGIPLEEARQLVIRGFFAELVSKIGISDLQDRIMSAIEAELSTTAAQS